MQQVPRNAVGPTAEMLAYGDAVFQKTGPALQPKQFAARKTTVIAPSVDNGWLGPLGVTSMHSSAGSLYGYGVTPDNPQY